MAWVLQIFSLVLNLRLRAQALIYLHLFMLGVGMLASTLWADPVLEAPARSISKEACQLAMEEAYVHIDNRGCYSPSTCGRNVGRFLDLLRKKFPDASLDEFHIVYLFIDREAADHDSTFRIFPF